MSKGIVLEPRVNKANKQINFQLTKSKLPKKIKQNLPRLKGIKIEWEDFEFDDI